MSEGPVICRYRTVGRTETFHCDQEVERGGIYCRAHRLLLDDEERRETDREIASKPVDRPDEDLDPWERWGLVGSTNDSRSTAELMADVHDAIPRAGSPETHYLCHFMNRNPETKVSTRCETVALPNERYCRIHLTYLQSFPKKPKTDWKDLPKRPRGWRIPKPKSG